MPGYQKQSKSKAQHLDWITGFLHNKYAAVALDAVEQILAKFPNDFEIVFKCASPYKARATESKGTKQNLRALGLYEIACSLIDQNTDETISIASIRTCMAQIYRSLCRYDKAAELLKANNPCGANNALPGEVLAQNDHAEEALPYLSRAMLSNLNDQLNIASGLVNAYMRMKRHHAAMEATEWIEAVVGASVQPGHPTYPDKVLNFFLVIRAYAYLLLQQPDAARTALRKAKALAERFDRAPDDSADHIRFVQVEYATAYDDFGATAADGIAQFVRTQDYPALTALWEQVYSETNTAYPADLHRC